MKNYNLLFIASLFTLDIYSSHHHPSIKRSSTSNLLDYQEMTHAAFSTTPLPARLYEDGSGSNNLNTFYTAPIQHNSYLNQPIIQPTRRLLVAEDTNTIVVPHNSPNNQYLISSGTSVIAVPVPFNYETRDNQKLSVTTRAIFAFVVALSMIELGFDIIDVCSYYSSPHSIHVGPTFPIAKLTNAVLRNAMLCSIYKLNQDRLG